MVLTLLIFVVTCSTLSHTIPGISLTLVLVFGAAQARRERHIGQRVLLSQITISNLTRDLGRVEEQDAETEHCADHKHGDVAWVCDGPSMVRLAVLGQPWQAREPHYAKEEQDWSKKDEHVVCDTIDDELEAARVLLVAHESTSEDEADEGRVDSISREYQSHPDLWFVAIVKDFWLTR